MGFASDSDSCIKKKKKKSLFEIYPQGGIQNKFLDCLENLGHISSYCLGENGSPSYQISF